MSPPPCAGTPGTSRTFPLCPGVDHSPRPFGPASRVPKSYEYLGIDLDDVRGRGVIVRGVTQLDPVRMGIEVLGRMEEAAEIVCRRPGIEVRTRDEVRDGLPVERIDLFSGFAERAAIRMHPGIIRSITEEIAIRPVFVFIFDVGVDAWTQEREGRRIDQFVHVDFERARLSNERSGAHQDERHGQRCEEPGLECAHASVPPDRHGAGHPIPLSGSRDSGYRSWARHRSYDRDAGSLGRGRLLTSRALLAFFAHAEHPLHRYVRAPRC